MEMLCHTVPPEISKTNRYHYIVSNFDITLHLQRGLSMHCSCKLSLARSLVETVLAFTRNLKNSKITTSAYKLIASSK